MTTHLETEIHEQPEALSRLLNEESEHIADIAGKIRDFDPTFVLIAARGTSDNAARYAQYALGIEYGLPVALAAPSIHTLYHAQPRMNRALVIGISQSGRSEDVRQVIDDARAQGALTLSITNEPESPIAQAAANHIWLRCGEEVAVAATKTYTTQVMALAMLVGALTGRAEMQTALAAVPDHMQATLALADGIAGWVEQYRDSERYAVLGRGYHYCTAFEIGQKVKEMNSVTCEQYSEADFRHGPIAIVQRGFPVIVVAPTGKPLPLMIDLLGKLQARGAERIVITDQPDIQAEQTVMLPSGMPEWLAPICAVVPGQIYAMRLAEAKGLPIDQPEGLTKVTVTR
ncbi:MAG: SIS domain-containing protein [Anaerolineae bacterium]|nr:SIS domain-containing protein [Anaerolineae bacterium]